jgi:hypothetical protein
MKTRKHFNVMALFAIIAILALSMTGCEGEDDKPTGGGGTSEELPYGTLPNGVGIYKGDASITDAQMATAVQKVIAGYNGVTDSACKTEINRVLTKVIIISHKNYTWDGHIFGLKYGYEVTDIKTVFEAMGSGGLPQMAW